MSEMADGVFERVLSVTGPATLDIAIDSGFIRVRAGESGSVRIRGTLRAQNSLFSWGAEERVRELEAHPPVEQSGNAIRIGGIDGHVAVSLEILAPADTRIQAELDSGDVRVEGIAGPVDCRTDSGEIEISAAQAGVRARTDSGDIRIRQVKGPVFAEVDSGDIDATDISGEIRASADSGDIRISQTIPAPIRAECDSGSISVKLVPEAGYDVRAETDHGRITARDLDSNGRLRGGGPLVDLQTDSGDIDIM